MRIIYPTEAGGVAVVAPAGATLSAAELAALAVPAGVPYRVVSAEDIPADRSARDRWTADFSAYDGIGGAP